MSFKDFLQEDIDTVFFNVDEFSEIHLIDDIPMPIVIDEDELEEYKNRRDGDYEGFHRASVLFYVKKDDIGDKPAVNSVLELDDRTYLVLASSDENGIIKIVLEWNEDC